MIDAPATHPSHTATADVPTQLPNQICKAALHATILIKSDEISKFAPFNPVERTALSCPAIRELSAIRERSRAGESLSESGPKRRSLMPD